MSRSKMVEYDPKQAKEYARFLSALTKHQLVWKSNDPIFRYDVMRRQAQFDLGLKLIAVTPEFRNREIRRNYPIETLAIGYGKRAAGWITTKHPEKRIVALYHLKGALPIANGWDKREIGVGGNSLLRLTRSEQNQLNEYIQELEANLMNM